MTHAHRVGLISRLAPLELEGPAGPIEALLLEHDAHDHALVAVVCHPHPLYGGTLHNKVVHRVASALHQLGAAVLRFNYRGVGKSAGAYDRGDGETEDARAALSAVSARYPGARRWLAGFSFGAAVAARLAASEAGIEQLVLIAPSVATADFDMLRTLATPKLVVQGTADTICPPDLLKARFPDWAEPRELVEIPGGTHFFDKQLAPLSEALLEALAPRAAGRT